MPLEPATTAGHAVAGICFIRLERFRPTAIPIPVGLSVRERRTPRCDSVPDRRPWTSTFRLQESTDRLAYWVRSRDGYADVDLAVRVSAGWQPSRLSATFDDVSVLNDNM